MPTPTGHDKSVSACHRGRGAVLYPGSGGVWAPKPARLAEMADFWVFSGCGGHGGACMHGLTLGVLSGRPMGANWMVDWQLFGPPTFLTQQSSWYVLLLLNTHDSGSFYNPSPTYNPKIVLRETRNDNPQLGFGFSASKMHNPSPYPGDIMRWLVEACLVVGLHLFRGICFFFPILFLRFCYCSYMTVIYRVFFSIFGIFGP